MCIQNVTNYALVKTNPKKHFMFLGLTIVLKPMVYEIIVFMVRFYLGSVKSISYNANIVKGHSPVQTLHSAIPFMARDMIHPS
jgi:hypothetical protein